MGAGRFFRCPNCGDGCVLATGVGEMYGEEYKGVVKDIKDGVYGEDFKNLMLSRNDVIVDLEKNLYICDKCGEWTVNYCFDFYVPKTKEESERASKKGFCVYPHELKENYECILKVEHTCEKCKSGMRKVAPNEEVSLKCEMCGTVMLQNSSIDWD